jgi:hypothetical protein
LSDDGSGADAIGEQSFGSISDAGTRTDGYDLRHHDVRSFHATALHFICHLFSIVQAGSLTSIKIGPAFLTYVVIDLWDR